MKLIFGTGSRFGRFNYKKASSIVDYAISNDIKAFDTAYHYGNKYNQVIDYLDYYTRNGDEDAAVMVLKILDEYKSNGLKLQMANNLHKMFAEGSPTYNKLKKQQEQTQSSERDVDASRGLRVESLNNLNELVNKRIYQ